MTTRSATILKAAAVAAALAAPAAADEFADVLEEALAAYREGDVAGARKDLDYAVKLLAERKAEELAALLPAAPAGWTREEADAEGAGMMAMFGGGTAAAATYRRGAEDVTITLVADAPMVNAVAAMVSGMSSIAGTQSRRIQRTPFAVADGQMQGVVDGRVLVVASGAAPDDDKAALLDLMDFDKLARF